jgi:Ran GTPase-activating protein (RanGAP) involved in mRNA processing and transport
MWPGDWFWMAWRGELFFEARPRFGAPSVAEAVRARIMLQKLIIHGGWFGDDGAEELGAALAENTCLLRKLQLRGCSFGARGLRGIAEGLETSETITEIRMAGIEIGDAGAEIMANLLLSNPQLKCLDMVDCNIGATGATAIATALKTNTSLKELSIFYDDIGDAGAEIMADSLLSNSSLEGLCMGDCDIGAVGVKAIARALKTNTSLEELTISDNDIGDDGAEILADLLLSNSSLEFLLMANCGIGAIGATAIAQALKTNTSLMDLGIAHNNIGDAGAAALADALASTTSLKRLFLCLRGKEMKEALALGRAWGANLALSLDFGLDACDVEYTARVREEAGRVRALALLRREKLVAFGMAMIKRLGGGTAKQVRPTNTLEYFLFNITALTRSSREASVFHHMCKDVFRMVGEAYQL